jgi:hypothetical protein
VRLWLTFVHVRNLVKIWFDHVDTRTMESGASRHRSGNFRQGKKVWDFAI